MKLHDATRDLVIIGTAIAVLGMVIYVFGGFMLPPEPSTLIESSVKIVSHDPPPPKPETPPDSPAMPAPPAVPAPPSLPEQPKTGAEKSGGSGSGTVVGYTSYYIGDSPGVRHSIILTAEHVLSELPTVDVYWKGHKIPGRVVARDHEIDLALIEVPVVLPKAEMYFGDVDLGAAQWVVGYPFGTGISITYGFVSTMDRTIALQQGSAAVWPGNSGGGLFVLKWHLWHSRFVLVGVVDAVYTARTGVMQRTIVNTISYSVSMDKVKKFLVDNHVSF
ncbi:trypsin-like peptidase domain-containing protein [Candidatus Kaiserbacteria bacterium]|nr:trypsin-like peptidase domain-containing protein [Candidatus Kaiserbacteria bacterium]